MQKEVDALAEQVRAYTGNSKKDKEYMYLDEMLTRELIKLDDIETEGRDNVRQARKNAIKSIQNTISLLESKASPPASQQPSREEAKEENKEEGAPGETMDVDRKEEQSVQSNEPIPLPPGPSIPTKVSSGDNIARQTQEAQKDSGSAERLSEEVRKESQEEKKGEKEQEQKESVNQTSNEPVDTTPLEKVESIPATETQQHAGEVQTEGSAAPEKKEKETNVEEKKDGTPTKKEKVEKKKKSESVSTDKQEPTQQEEKEEPSKDQQMEVDKPAGQSPKTLKKVKKSKKQTPISQEPIPLPAPEGTETSAK